MLIGIVGKPSVGKSTFFKALTMSDVEISPRPFTTIEPNKGIGHVRVECPEKDFGTECNPNNSYCEGGNRFVPFEVLDVAGLVPGAHEGRGLGNQFLDDLRRADVLIHLVDLSGRTDAEGNETRDYDPSKDVEFLENELDQWFFSIVKKNWETMVRRVSIKKGDLAKELAEILSGLGITYYHIVQALSNLGLSKEELGKMDGDSLFGLSSELRRISKPTLIVGNKADISGSENNLKKLEGHDFVACSAEISLALREANRKGIIDYVPGDSDFEMREGANEAQKKALDFMRSFLQKNNGTGVQEAINRAVLDLLGCVVVFPVEDENKLTNNKGKVLPDAFILPKNSTALDLAYKVHTDIGENFVRAVDCRTKRGVGKAHELKNRDVIKIHYSK